MSQVTIEAIQAKQTELFARAIEQAVIERLAGVSVEPLFWVYEAGTPDGYFYFYEVDRTRKDGNYRDKKCWKESPVFTELQLAAARVQALEEAAKVCDAVPEFFRGWKDLHPLQAREAETAHSLAIGIRALIGKEST